MRYQILKTSFAKSSLTLAVLLLLSACSEKSAEDTAPDPVALVTLGSAETGGVDQTVSIYGVADSGASGTVALAAPSEAIVATIDAPIGTKVAAGQAVVHLVPSAATRQDAAKTAADAAAADASLARAKRLRTDNLVSDADVEAAAATARAADAALAANNTRLQALVLKAPQDGYVVTMTQTPGDQVSAGTTIATVTGNVNLRARFGLDPTLATRVSPGAVVHITPADGSTFDATVISVSPVVDPATRLASVITSIPAGTALSSGQALRGNVTVASAGEALTIPYAALLDDGGQPYVFAVKAGVAHRVDVATGAQSGDRIVILKGLHNGDQVVTVGGTALDDGMKVRLK